MKANTYGKWSLGFLCAIFAMLLLAVAPGFAQTTSGTIVGTVTDASGGVIPCNASYPDQRRDVNQNRVCDRRIWLLSVRQRSARGL